jgi:hypothetical protein
MTPFGMFCVYQYVQSERVKEKTSFLFAVREGESEKMGCQ